ncbi:hypothetical protein M0805_008161 [Coniferiporia weirii]|nr:hypothetical protein M0805_008161 [Coniferiporia weirii]
MSLLDLIDDILLVVFEHLQVKEILVLRQTCKRLNALSHLRAVWLNACTRYVLQKRLPFDFKSIDDLGATVLEERTRHALRLKATWSSPNPAPARVLSFAGSPLNGLLEVRFVLKRDHEWIITLSDGIWPVIGCWDLKLIEHGCPKRVGEWSYKGATIKEMVVNSDMEADTCMVVSIVQTGQQRLEIQSIKPIPGTRQIVFETAKIIETNYKPVSFDGDIVAISDESSEIRILNWKTGYCAILQNTEGNEGETPRDKCLQVLFVHSGILVARSRSIDLFPTADLSPPDSLAPILRPLGTFTFGWIDGIAVAPSPEIAGYPYPPISILVRAESGDPWATDIHSLNRYILYPNPDFVSVSCQAAQADKKNAGPYLASSEALPPSSIPEFAKLSAPPHKSPYIFPPVHTSRIPSRRVFFLRCTTLALGAAGTALWVHPRRRRHPSNDISMSVTQTLCAAVFPGPFASSEENVGDAAIAGERVEGVHTLQLYHDLNQVSETWTAMDYVESRGCIALGSVGGHVTVLYMV